MKARLPARLPKELVICLHSGSRPIGRIIRWFTHSKYSHVSLLLPDGRHAEAREFKGVVVHDRFSPKPGEQVDFFRLEQPLSAGELDILARFIESTRGEPYDYAAVAGFVLGFRRQSPSDTRWDCSEWLYRALQACGRQLLRTTESWTVCPHEIGLSPYLIPTTFNP